MTACNNNVRGGKASRVITAALVATLSVGTPMAAIASTVSEGGIDMLVASDKDNVLAGTIVEWTDKSGKVTTSTEFAANGTAQYLIPTKVEPKYGDTVDVKLEDGYNFVYYKADERGSLTLPDGTKVTRIGQNANSNVESGCKDAGTYYVGVGTTSGSSDAQLKQMTFLKFTIVNNSLDEARITGADGKDVDFTYKADGFVLGSDYKFMIGDKTLTENVDYTYAVYSKDGSPATLENAGDYIIRLTGAGVYAGDTTDIDVTVNKLDLSKASLTVANNEQDALTSVNLPNATDFAAFNLNDENLDSSALKGELKIAFDASKSTDSVAANNTPGAFAYTVTAKDSDSENITGSATVVVTRYSKVATFKYDDISVTAGDDHDITASGKAFDASKLVVAESPAEDAKDVEYDITYTTEDGKAATAESVKIPGTYYAKITAKSDSYKFGGSIRVKFTVNSTVIPSANVFVMYKGSVKSAISGVYDGSDFAKDISVVVYDADKNEVPSSEFVMKYTDDNNGNKEVNELVNAGSYTLTISPKEGSIYSIQGSQTVKITISAVNSTAGSGNASVSLAPTSVNGTANAYPYTGAAITPSFEYVLKADPDNAIALPETAYNVTYKMKQEDSTYKAVDEIIEAGDYEAVLSDNVDDSNYVIANQTINFSVSTDRVFKDVPNNMYYSEAVYYVQDKHYMNGNAGLFNPEAELNRYQLATVLMNIAGGSSTGDFVNPGYDEFGGVVTGFSDVDGHMHYAAAIAWAHDNDLVQGYGDGTFGPEDSISREQFAQMLFNYAKKVGVDTAVDTEAVLAKCNDGAAVNDWAREAVAWAVDNGLMAQGSDIMPTTTITRAQAAIMVMRFDGLL